MVGVLESRLERQSKGKVFPMGGALSGVPSHLLCVEGKVA